MASIPPGWVQLPDGSYSPPSAIAKGLVRGTPATNEGQLHDEILAWCRSKGFPVVHSRMDRPATSGIGTPDFVVALPKGQTVWVEAKTAKGKLRPEQAAWIAALRHHGHQAHVVRSFAEFLHLTQPPEA